MASPVHVAIVGAPGTGTDVLASALGAALHTAGIAGVVQDHDTSSLGAFLRQNRHPTPRILLTGLDWPLAPADDGASRTQHDAQLRQTLDQQGWGYAVVYGTTIDQRCACALQMVAHHAALPPARDASQRTPWQWNCEKCSDAQCEHQLFRALVQADSV